MSEGAGEIRRAVAAECTGIAQILNTCIDRTPWMVAIYPELAQAFGTLYQPSFFAEDAVENPVSMMPLLQGDRLHPNQAGIAHMVKRLGPNLLRLGARIRQQRQPE